MTIERSITKGRNMPTEWKQETEQKTERERRPEAKGTYFHL